MTNSTSDLLILKLILFKKKCSGYAADLTHLPITLPMERVIKSMQTSKQTGKSLNAFDVAGSIFRDQGWAGFYRGLWAYAVLCCRPAIQYTVFEQLRTLVLRSRQRAANGRPSTSLTSIEAFALGAMARAIATFFVYPFIRAKVMAQAASTEPRSKSISGSLKGILATEGVAGLYRGVKPELFRGMLSAAIMLMIKERVLSFSKRLIESRKKSSL
jgi:adenine nucleotide transporter 17